MQSIDRYQLVSRIGKGGMAEVFRAKLTGIGGFERDVALKVLLPSFAAEPEFVEMLLDEARIAGAIDHPNVLQVLDVGRKGDVFYLVMEYVDGKDLRAIAKMIPGGRIPIGMALYVVNEMLRGLEAVHDAVDERGQQRNIIHRDISPGNVMVDRRGFVKLGDFGIAHASGRITRTRVGAVKGKSRYMAPEQLSGTPVDHRADLYAVGVTLFEAILGDFARESSRPTIYGPMFTFPERLPPGAVPPDVEAILRHSITDTAEARYRDCGEMRADLELALHRLAPGYGPDTLARELRRLIGNDRTPSQPLDTSRQATPSRGVSVRPVKWRGVPTAEHSLPSASSSLFDGTPVQNLAASPSAALPSASSPLPRGRTSSQGFEVEAERTIEEVRTIPPDFAPNPAESQMERSLGRRGSIDRRLGIGLIVAALALVTVGIAAAVAGSGGGNASIAIDEVQKPRPTPQPRVEARAMPLPASTGFVEIRGPVGATLQIGRTYYPPAPTQIELPSGDYIVRMRVGKKRRLIVRPIHIVAGNTIILR